MSGYVSLDLVRQNYAEETERGVNKQINLELKAFYSYLSMVSEPAYITACIMTTHRALNKLLHICKCSLKGAACKT